MRSLNTSLPGATSTKQQMGEPSEQLLTAFKAAALSVTNLYKSAAADQGRARAEGYQDALDELLAFLDKEDIGLSDGEGWRIRRWATERLDGRDSVSQHMESDDENSEKPERGSSPVLQRSQSATRLSSTSRPTRTASPARTESAPPPTSHLPKALSHSDLRIRIHKMQTLSCQTSKIQTTLVLKVMTALSHHMPQIMRLQESQLPGHREDITITQPVSIPGIRLR
jgi:hypothetical protein